MFGLGGEPDMIWTVSRKLLGIALVAMLALILLATITIVTQMAISNDFD
jgi:hypothetical protein